MELKMGLALLAVVNSLTAALIAFVQSRTSRKILMSNTILKLQDNALGNRISGKFERIANLEGINSWGQFVSITSDEDRALIDDVITHLNYCAQIVEEEILPRQMIWNRYFWMYRISYQRLNPWWLAEARKNHPKRYSSFERLANAANAITEEAIERFDRNRGH